MAPLSLLPCSSASYREREGQTYATVLGRHCDLVPRRAYEGGRQAPRPSLPVSLPLKGAPMSDESTWENYINSLLKFVIWKWVHDRIGYIVKNGINKGDFKGGGHTNKNLAPPPHKCSGRPLRSSFGFKFTHKYAKSKSMRFILEIKIKFHLTNSSIKEDVI